MLERSALIEQFSTFIELTEDRFSRWVADSRLSRSMAIALSGSDTQSDRALEPLPQVWTLYWYERWCATPEQTRESIPFSHLAAFVQEACYWAAYKTAQGFSSSQYGLVDYFQLAIARFDYVLKHFSPQQGSRLDAYARIAFSNIIRDTLRQRKELDICSDWGLLRRLSQKRLEESLRAAGLGEDIDQYVLAWRCYMSAYTPSTQASRQLNQPNAEVWQAIAREFNRQRQTLMPLPPSRDAITLGTWLRKAAAAARSYLYPKATSLNTPRPGMDSGELQDTLANPEEASLLDAMVLQEEVATRCRQQAELNTVLQQALQQLSPEAQSILALYYRQGQTQQQIAQGLDVKQYTVSRRLSKAREALLKQVAIWSRDTLHISLTSDVINSISTSLDEWLHSYYEAPPQEIPK